MPLMTIRTTATVAEADVQSLLKACSEKLATLTGKPESYCMTVFEPVAGMTMAGTSEPACLIEVRSVGKLSGEQTRAMSRAFCSLVTERTGVAGRRVYVNFNDYPGAMWGHDGSTFG